MQTKTKRSDWSVTEVCATERKKLLFHETKEVNIERERKSVAHALLAARTNRSEKTLLQYRRSAKSQFTKPALDEKTKKPSTQLLFTRLLTTY